MNAITVGKGLIVLENSARAALQGLKLYGRSSQNGMPSPTNPDACLLNYWMNEWLKKLGKV